MPHVRALVPGLLRGCLLRRRPLPRRPRPFPAPSCRKEVPRLPLLTKLQFEDGVTPAPLEPRRRLGAILADAGRALLLAAPDFSASRCARLRNQHAKSDRSAHCGLETKAKGNARGRPVSPYGQRKLIPRVSRADLVDQCGGISQSLAVRMRDDIASAQKEPRRKSWRTAVPHPHLPGADEGAVAGR